RRTAGSAAVTDTNRRNRAPHQALHGLPMIVFWLMWVGLVLGGLIASLWYQELGRGAAFRRPARLPVARAEGDSRGRRPEHLSGPARAGADFWPPPRVAPRGGPLSERSAG